MGFNFWSMKVALALAMVPIQYNAKLLGVLGIVADKNLTLIYPGVG